MTSSSFTTRSTEYMMQEMHHCHRDLCWCIYSFTLTLFFDFSPHLNVPSPEIDYSTRLSSQVHSQSSRSAWLYWKRQPGPCEVLGYLHFCRINILRSFSSITWEKEKKRGAPTKIIAKYVVAYRLPQRLWACFIRSVAQKPITDATKWEDGNTKW